MAKSDFGEQKLITNKDGVTFDLNKDYTKAINEAKAKGEDTTQLEAEKNAKVNSSAYGGKYKTGSDDSSLGSSYNENSTVVNRTSNSDPIVTNVIKPQSQFDASAYLREMLGQKLQAELAALKSTYDQNMLDLDANRKLIPKAYDQQRNQAAAQNDIQRMYMNELGMTRGLNTGATGQMALAQSAALQNNMAQIGTQEAQSLADNDLYRQKLTAAYRSAADQASADGNAQLASSLYDEYVRQQNMLWQQQLAALEQQNWQSTFDYQKQQDALAQQNWKAQFDYQKQQDDLDYKLALQKLYAANQLNADQGLDAGTPGSYQVYTSQLSSAGRGLWNIIKQLGDNASAAAQRVQIYLDDGRISQNEADIIMRYFGY